MAHTIVRAVVIPAFFTGDSMPGQPGAVAAEVWVSTAVRTGYTFVVARHDGVSGLADEVAIYDHVLGPNRVQARFAASQVRNWLT